MGHPLDLVPVRRTYSRVGSPQAAALQDKHAPVWALQGPQLLQGISTCSRVGLSMDCRVSTCSDVMSPQTAGKYLLHCGFFQNFYGLQGSLCSGAQNLLLTEATPAASPPPAKKTSPCKPNTISNWNLTILMQTALNIFQTK